MLPEADFDAARPQLTAVAFRLLGSIHDAEDAVQTTWLRATAADSGEVRNSAAWLTTVLTRVCLDHLRARARRPEEPLSADLVAADELAADEQYLRRESVSRALLVVLDRLTPTQRVAYVLHDLFDLPFRQIAETLNTTAENAKKQASRARRRIAAPSTTAERDAGADPAVVAAFLDAAGGGDLDRMIALMVEDCVRVADADLVPPGTAPTVTGARAIAEETVLFADRIRAAAPLLVDGRPAHVIAPGGHLLALIHVETRASLVSRVTISRAPAHSAMTLNTHLP